MIRSSIGMAYRGQFVIALVSCLLLVATSSTAQTVGATTGALDGKVTDQTGAPLPGVSVVASGAAMMASRTSVTDASGRYEVSFVPPGEYTLVFSLPPEFRQVIRKGIVVNLGWTTTVDEVLVLAAEQTVEVLGQSPLVDRSNTSIVVSHNVRQLSDLPASRSSAAIIDATPGVELTRFDVGGSAGPAGGPFSAYGTSGLNRPTIEGIAITGYNPLGFTLDYGSFEHAAVRLGAHGPEWPWPGVALQVVTKSGGNQHRGSMYLDYEHRSWQAFNIDEDQIARNPQFATDLPAREANRLWSYRDANVDGGGPVRKDRLWWYLSVRDQESSARHVSFPVKPVSARVTNLGGKLTAQTGGSKRFVAFGQTTWNHQPTRLEGYLRPAASVNEKEDSTSDQIAQGGLWKVEWNAVVADKFYLEVLGGQFIGDRHERPNGTSPRVEDLTNLKVSGGNRDWDLSQRDDQIVATASYQTAGWGGSHHVKAGGEFRRRTGTERWYLGFPGQVLHVTQNSIANQVLLFQTPSEAIDGTQWYAASLQDAWRIADRLTLTLGVRFDRYRVFFPAQGHPAGEAGSRSWPAQTFAAVDNVIDWNLVAPRLSVSHDLAGNGRTVLKLTYGQYSMPPGNFAINRNSREWWERFEWVDADGDRLWDAGENTRLLERRGGVEIESIDPGLKLGFTREATARIEREIVSNVAVETGIVWRGVREPFLRQDETQPFSAFTRTVTKIDPGLDQVSPSDDREIVVYDLPQSVLTPSYVVRNVPNANNDYVTWEVKSRRLLSRRWSLTAGFSHTWVREHAAAYLGQGVRANVYPLTPNDLINTGDGGRHEFRMWSARAYGTYEGPWGLRITPFLRHQSGQPYGRTFVVTNLNLGSLRVLAEPIGTRRMDHVTLVDLRIEKAFVLGPNRRVAGFVDGFNLFNANAEQTVNWSSAGFQRPLSIVPPRIARIGVRLGW
jgi:carboxypeptidase family protein